MTANKFATFKEKLTEAFLSDEASPTLICLFAVTEGARSEVAGKAEATLHLTVVMFEFEFCRLIDQLRASSNSQERRH